MRRYITKVLLHAAAFAAAASAEVATSPVEQCDIDLRVYSTASNCLKGFSSDYIQSYSIIADGKCHDSGNEDLRYYIATCNTDVFELARSRCTDKTCSDCAVVNDFSGKYQEGGCLVDWSVSDLDKPGSVPFSAIADGECQDSGIEGLGHYIADCDDGGWFQLTRSSCSNETCSDCTGAAQNKISTLREWPLAFTYEGKRECNVDAFYKEQVWSVSGSCQRQGCSGIITPTLPRKWWATTIEEGSIQCIFGNDYPVQYHTNATRGEDYLFDSREECCDADAGISSCQPTSSPIELPNAENWTFNNIAPTPSPATEVDAVSSAYTPACSYYLAILLVYLI